MGLARERERLIAAGLDPSVVDTMQRSRAPSTRKVYQGKLEAFEEWCRVKHPSVNPVFSSIPIILEFLQDRVHRNCKASTVRGYLAAIRACHQSLDGDQLSKHPWVVQFMAAVRRDSLTARPLIPAWDLEVVLRGLSQPPFEPLESTSLKLLSYKTALLLALTTAKRVSDLHALSVSEDCMRFSPDGRQVLLKPHLHFIPKNKVVQHVPVRLLAFHPPPFGTEEDRRLNFLCPVRALKMYCEMTQARRKSHSLFVPHGKSTAKMEIAKATLSGWIVDAIRLAYDSANVARPEGFTAHSTSGMSSSWGLWQGTTIQEVCLAANWTSPSTFAAHYQLDVAPRSLAHSVLQVAADSSAE